MVGLLDPKERIIDAVITDIGKEKLHFGNFKPTFVSFSDLIAIYKTDTIEPGKYKRVTDLNFEAQNYPQDQITFPIDELGRITIDFKHNNIKISYDDEEKIKGLDIQATKEIVKQSLTNLKDLHLLRTKSNNKDEEREIEEFEKDIETSFVIDSERDEVINYIDIIEKEPLFFDDEFQDLNYCFLHPYVQSETNENVLFDIYQNLDAKKEKLDLDGDTYIVDIPFEKSNIFIQVFEKEENGMLTKLDLVESNGIYFAGKVFFKEDGTPIFLKLFTIIFENETG